MSEIDWSKYENFSEEEFSCPCCEESGIKEEVVRTLQRLRDRVQGPIHVTSGYRCPAHNEAVGGAPESSHMQGLAVDFLRPEGINSKDLVDWMSDHFSGIGLRFHGNNQYLHGDLKQREAVWTYG
jgi:uncharacterized protein YcbK (DUF882 family)